MFKTISIWSAPQPADQAAFEEYYLSVHTPLAGRIPGLIRFESTLTTNDIASVTPAFYRVAELYFSSAEKFLEATETQEWADLTEDAGYIIGRFV